MGITNIIGSSARAYRDGHRFWVNGFAQILNYPEKETVKKPQKKIITEPSDTEKYAGRFFGAITGLPYALIKSFFIALFHNIPDSFDFLDKFIDTVAPGDKFPEPNKIVQFNPRNINALTIFVRGLLGIVGLVPFLAVGPAIMLFVVGMRIIAESCLAIGKTTELIASIIIGGISTGTKDPRSKFKQVLGTILGLPGVFISLPVVLGCCLIVGICMPHARLQSFLLSPFVHIYKNWLIKPGKRVKEEILYMGTPEHNPVRFKANLIAILTFGLGKSFYKNSSGNTELVYPEKLHVWSDQYGFEIGDDSVIEDYQLFNTINKSEPRPFAAGLRKTFSNGYDPSVTKETLSSLLHGYNDYRRSDPADKKLNAYLDSEVGKKSIDHLKSVYTKGRTDLKTPETEKIDAVVQRLKNKK